MSHTETDQITEIWHDVRRWPPQARLALASKILHSLEAEVAPPAREGRSIADLIGAWKSDHPPTDEEVERILEEERMRK